MDKRFKGYDEPIPKEDLKILCGDFKKEYKQVKLFGKEEDGFYLGRIEDFSIDKGWFGIGSGKLTYYICNRRSMAWIFSIFTGYRQIGMFTTYENFDRGDLVIAKIKDGKIVELKKGTGDWTKW